MFLNTVCNGECTMLSSNFPFVFQFSQPALSHPEQGVGGQTHSLAADQTSQPRRKSNYSSVRGPSRDSSICKVNADKQNLEPKTLSAIEFCSHGPWFQNPSELLVGPRLALTQKGSLGIDTQRKNICVTNPTCARIGSRISFDMIKSLRTANVVWFPKCKPFKTKNI